MKKVPYNWSNYLGLALLIGAYLFTVFRAEHKQIAIYEFETARTAQMCNEIYSVVGPIELTRLTDHFGEPLNFLDWADPSKTLDVMAQITNKGTPVTEGLFLLTDRSLLDVHKTKAGIRVSPRPYTAAEAARRYGDAVWNSLPELSCGLFVLIAFYNIGRALKKWVKKPFIVDVFAFVTVIITVMAIKWASSPLGSYACILIALGCAAVQASPNKPYQLTLTQP